MVLEDADEDETPEWMNLLSASKPNVSSTPSQGLLPSKQRAAATARKVQEIPRAAAVPAPATPPEAAQQEDDQEDDQMESLDLDRFSQLLGLLFADKESIAIDQLKHKMEAYLRRHLAVPAFPRRLFLLRGPVGRAEWAMKGLREGESSAFTSADTLAVQLSHICSPTDFSADLRHGKWQISPRGSLKDEEAARAMNEARVRLAMGLGLEPLYVDDSNVNLFQMQPYVSLAKRMGYEVTVVSPSEINPNWQDVDLVLSKQNYLSREALEDLVKSFEDLPEGDDAEEVIMASECPVDEDSAPIQVLPAALLCKLERLLQEGTGLMRYVPPDGDGWGVNGELSGEWHHFREKADGSCRYDGFRHWFSRSPEESAWPLAELKRLTDLRTQGLELPQADLPSAVSHPGLFVKDDDMAGQVFKELDENHDGVITQKEIRGGVDSGKLVGKSATSVQKESSAKKAQSEHAPPPASRIERLRQRIREQQAEAPAAKRSRVQAVPESSAAPVGAAASEEVDEEASASTFLAAVKARLLEWGKVELYHEFIIALSGSVDAKAAVRILRGHDDLLAVFRRVFAPNADISAVKKELDEEDEDAPRPPSAPPPGRGMVKQESSVHPSSAVKKEIIHKANVKAEVKSERAPEVIPRPPSYGPNEARGPVMIGEDSDEEVLDEASIAAAVRKGRTECIAQLAKTLFKRERAGLSGARQRLEMVHYATETSAKPRFPRELFILRGLPGTGKSTYALQELLESTGHSPEDGLAAKLTHVCAADDFFETFQGETSVYKFESHRLDSVHSRNEVRTRLAMEAGIHPLFVDCANLRLWEMRPYVLLADRLGYVVTIVEPKDVCEKWNNVSFLMSANDTPDRQGSEKVVPQGLLTAMLKVFEPLPEDQEPSDAVRAAKRPPGPRIVQAEKLPPPQQQQQQQQSHQKGCGKGKGNKGQQQRGSVGAAANKWRR
eukprot:TRINITY_DN4615_c0_g1_i1.p1 TRINITY_DN4615_c0_g1~~TRINITY_DN4615_c0_g1_i1.p1  ORF type:complete len:952 (+),score=230.45 TRINITY_DN4615_c0_g1_i1:33-2888(+)